METEALDPVLRDTPEYVLLETVPEELPALRDTVPEERDTLLPAVLDMLPDVRDTDDDRFAVFLPAVLLTCLMPDVFLDIPEDDGTGYGQDDTI